MYQNISKRLYFTSQLHTNQRRKNKESTPFINHPIELFYLLAQAQISDENCLIAAILHDVIEDTEWNYNEVELEFGETVPNLILECTDDKSLSKVERKILQIEKAKKVSELRCHIKLADKISNLKTFIDTDMSRWTEERIIGYIIWDHLVVENLTVKNSYLYNLHQEILEKCIQKYEIEIENKDIIFNNYLTILL